jgi:DNA-binding GntR family transcriptional regulator
MGTIARAPLADEVYRKVLQRIQHGDLAPGSRVRDTDLAAQMGVSRTPVREALLRLSRDGALENLVGRGFRVRPLDPVEFGETGAILGELESLALRLAPTPTPDRIARLQAIDRSLEQTRGDPSRCLDLEDDWHAVLLEACPNRRLLDLIASLRQVTRRYLGAYMRGAGRLSLSTLPHQRILQAFREGGRDSAATAFDQQWHRALAELESWIARAVMESRK